MVFGDGFEGTAADLPVRVKERVIAEAEQWKYTPPRVSDKEKLAKETKQRRLAEADGVIYRQRFPSENEEFEFPSIQEIETAYNTRLEILGPSDPDTITAQYVYAKNLLGSNSNLLGMKMLSETIQRKEESTPVPDAELIEMWFGAAGTFALNLDFVQAESINIKLANSLAKAFDDGRLPNISMHSNRIGSARLLGFDTRSEVEDVADFLSTDIGQSLRDRVRDQLPKYAWSVASRSRYYDDAQRKWLQSRALPTAERAIKLDSTSTYAWRALAIGKYRQNEFDNSLVAIENAIKYQIKLDEQAFPFDAAILAMSHFQLAQPLPDSDPARAEHLAAANEALENCQAIMTDPAALNPAGQPWTKDKVAQSLLAEAEALIGGGEE